MKYIKIVDLNILSEGYRKSNIKILLPAVVYKVLEENVENAEAIHTMSEPDVGLQSEIM